MADGKFSVVVVTWNSAREIAGLLASIDQHLEEVEVVVVDNASTDATREVVDEWHGRKRIIELDENKGFGAAANIGVRAATREIVVLLNPDTVLIDDSVSDLARFAAETQALCGPELLNPDRSRQPSASPRPASWEVGVSAFVPGAVLPSRLQARCEPWRSARTTEAGWLTGACIAAPRETLLRLGPFDESLHLFGEDMDLGMRAQADGVPNLFVPEIARVVHLAGRSTAQRFADDGAAQKFKSRRHVVRKAVGRRGRLWDLLAQLLFHGSRYAAKILVRRDASREAAWLRAALAEAGSDRSFRASPRQAIAALMTRADVRSFSRDSLLLLGALGVLNASNYLFHVVVSRLLGPSSYGALAALLAVLMVLSVPFGVLHTVIAKRTAALKAAGRGGEVASYAADLMRTLLVLGVGIGAFILVFVAPALSAFLHVDLVSSALLAAYVTFSIFASVPLGVLQGEMRFRALAGLALLAVAVRLVLGIGLVAAGTGVRGAIFATAVAPLAAAAVGFTLLGVRRSSIVAARPSLGHLRGEFDVALVSLTAFWLLAELDIVLARHFLSEHDAGLYSSAGLLTKALLFLPAAVSVVAFPRFVAAREQRAGHTHWLRMSLGAVVGILVLAFAGLVLLRDQLVVIAFGNAFSASASLVPMLAAAMALLSIVGLLTYFHVAMGSKAYVLLLVGVTLEGALITGFHDTPEQIALGVAATSALMAALMYQAAWSISRWRPSLWRAEAESSKTVLAAPADLDLSVVLPCHNAGHGLAEVLDDVLSQIEPIPAAEVIVVSDGSTDRSVAIAEGFAERRVRVIHYPLRRGKGQALRVGLEEARGEYVAFLDADGDIGAEAVTSFLSLMRLEQPDVVLGSKRHPRSEVHYPPARRVLSWMYHRLARLLFRVNVRDTQTGCKLIRRDVLAAVLPRLLEKRYAFDLEFLVVARALGFRRVVEAPVRIRYRFASHVDPRAVVRIGLDTLAIFYRHYILNTYREAGRQISAEPVSAADAPPLSLSTPRADRPLPTPAFSATGNGTSRAKRILVINWKDIRHPEAGGAEVFTHEVCRLWAADEHDVTLLTSSFRGGLPQEVIDGVRVRRLGRLRTGSFHLLVQRELARLRGFDVVIDEINTAPFLTPLWRRRLPPIVALIHQLAKDVLDAELAKPVAAVGRWLEPRALALYRDFPVVTVSESTRSDLRELGIRDVFVVPEGVETPPLNALPAKEPDPTFLYVGRLAANKRPEHAVDAFRTIRQRLPKARLWIVGQGPLASRLAEDLPAGAELLGYLPRAALFDRMARAHCLLVPSVREGWGLVVIEANAVGTPAVGYDVPGVRDSIRDGATGLLAEADNPQALGRRAADLVTDQAEYSRLRTAALAWGAQFSWETTAEQLMDIVEMAMGADRVDESTVEPALSH